MGRGRQKKRSPPQPPAQAPTKLATELDEAILDLEEKQKTRTGQRTQLTTLYKVIEKTVQERGSRTAVTTLLDQATLVLKASNDLNDELVLNPAKCQRRLSETVPETAPLR